MKKLLQKDSKVNIPLLAFFILYNVVSIYLLFNALYDKSELLNYALPLILLWAFGAFILLSLLILLKVNMKSNINAVLTFFSTPFPALFFIFIYIQFPSNEEPTETLEFIQDDRLKKIEKFHFSNGNLKKIQYYTSETKVTDTNKIKIMPEFELDSVVYYNSKGRRKGKFFPNEEKKKK